MKITCTIAAIAVGAAIAHADTGYVIENGGNSWSLGPDLSVTLLGFKDTTPGQTVTNADIMSDIDAGSGNVFGLFNGVGNLGGDLDAAGDVAAYESTTFFAQQFTFGSGDNLPYSNDIDAFTSAELTTDGFGSGRYISVFFLVHSGTVVFGNDGGGTSTAGGNGALGAFPASFDPEVPAPGSLALLGLAGLAGARRRR